MLQVDKVARRGTSAEEERWFKYDFDETVATWLVDSSVKEVIWKTMIKINVNCR